MSRPQTSGDKIRAEMASTPSFSINGRNWFRKGKCDDGTDVYCHLAKPENAPRNAHASTPAHNGYRLFWLFVKCTGCLLSTIGFLYAYVKLGLPLY